MGRGEAGLAPTLSSPGPRHCFARHLWADVRADRARPVRGRFPALDARGFASLGRPGGAIDGKTSRRSGGVDATELHLVSAFAAGAGVVLGQRATEEKSNEIKAATARPHE